MFFGLDLDLWSFVLVSLGFDLDFASTFLSLNLDFILASAGLVSYSGGLDYSPIKVIGCILVYYAYHVL